MPVYSDPQGNLLVSFSPAKPIQEYSSQKPDGLFGFSQRFFSVSRSAFSASMVWMALTAAIQIIITASSVNIFVNLKYIGNPVDVLLHYFVYAVLLFISNYLFVSVSKLGLHDISQEYNMIRDKTIFFIRSYWSNAFQFRLFTS